MPFFYAINIQGETTGGAATETDELRMLTVANQREVQIVSLGGAAALGTAGGCRLRLAQFTTPSTAGSGTTPTERDPGGPAASLTAFTAPTAGSTRRNQLTVGMPQTGGDGRWVAIEPAHAVTLVPNGGADGNADVFSISTTATLNYDYTLEFAE